jgi:hypothetical protein
MTSEESWNLTPREFAQRRKVRDQYIAMWRVETRNAPHFHREDKKPWSIDHFLNPQEVARSEQQKLQDEFELLKARAELGIALNSNSDMVPDWAKGPYFGPPKKSERLNG